jgi:hypothetical protein
LPPLVLWLAAGDNYPSHSNLIPNFVPERTG